MSKETSSLRHDVAIAIAKSRGVTDEMLPVVLAADPHWLKDAEAALDAIRDAGYILNTKEIQLSWQRDNEALRESLHGVADMLIAFEPKKALGEHVFKFVGKSYKGPLADFLINTFLPKLAELGHALKRNHP